MSVTYFPDTSALLKLYVAEEGSERMAQLLSRNPGMWISNLTRAEVISNLQRLLSVDRLITERQFSVVCAAFALDLARGRLVVVGVTSRIVDKAIRLLSRMCITPADAIHVSTAISLGQSVVVLPSDQRPNAILGTLGIKTIDPSRMPDPSV